MKTRRILIPLLYVICILFLVIYSKFSIAINKDIKSPITAPDKTITGPDPKDVIKRHKKLTPKVLEKADLVVYRLPIDNYLTDEETRKIELTVYVKNQGVKSTSNSLTTEGRTNSLGGYFKVLVEWTDDVELRTFNRLCERGFGPLGAGRTSHAPCKDNVPRGTIRKYRVTVDSLNWIDESNEGNNITSRAFDSR